MTLGQKLAMKYQMSESPVPKITQPSAVQPANTTITTTKKESSVGKKNFFFVILINFHNFKSFLIRRCLGEF